MDKFSYYINFYSKNTYVIFVIFVFLLLLINYFLSSNNTWRPSTETKDLRFYSWIVMVLFSILFIEQYYSSPKNVITNTIPLILLWISIKSDIADEYIWLTVVTFLAILTIWAIIGMSLYDEENGPNNEQNKISNIIKNIVSFFWTWRVLYSAMFIFILINYYWKNDISNTYTLILFVLWALLMTIDYSKLNLHNKIWQQYKNINNNNAIWEVFGVQSKKIFLVKLLKDSKNIKKFDIIKLNYSMQYADDMIFTGIVFDTYFLNKERRIKILQLSQEKNNINEKLEKNIVYKVIEKNEKRRLKGQLNIDWFVGIVSEWSTVGTIRFEYSKKDDDLDDLQEWDLLELKISEDKKLFYQVINWKTKKEILEAKNETWFIEWEAIQLWEWKQEKYCFEKFWRVPTINTPLFRASTTDIEVPDIEYPEYTLWVIPWTTLPSVINLDTAVSHHMALLWVTGSWKSVLAREIIKEISNDTKVFCIDFTGEYIEDLKALNPIPIIPQESMLELEEIIAEKTKSLDKSKILEYKKQIQSKLTDLIKEFIISDNSLSLFELPELSNTSFIIDFTQIFFEAIFNYAKQNKWQKICLVLEEAHTIIPETNFLWDLGDYGNTKALVSKMSQIALQGRKYWVWLMILGQRTANISKTVLTQCNTVICFQAFDDTSMWFLGNYVGKDLVQILPNLKPFHAVVTWKAIKSNLPMIINLYKEELDTKQ